MVDPFEDWLSRCPVKREIFDALCRHPYGIGTHDLCWQVWRGQEPDYSVTAIHVHLTRMRRAMRGLLPWLTIKSIARGGRKHVLVLRRPGGADAAAEH